MSVPKFSQHNTLEVTESYTESKQIAAGLSENYRFSHRMKATLLGDVEVSPLSAIRLSGLPGKLSGYWVVLSVTHLIGKEAEEITDGQIASIRGINSKNMFAGRTPYLMEVELGIDVLGDTTGAHLFKTPIFTMVSTTTGTELGVRDIQSDLEELQISTNPMLNTLGSMLSLSSDISQYGTVQPTSNTVNLVPAPPNFGIAVFESKWEAANE
jgi:hypothetical protein